MKSIYDLQKIWQDVNHKKELSIQMIDNDVLTVDLWPLYADIDKVNCIASVEINLKTNQITVKDFSQNKSEVK